MNQNNQKSSNLYLFFIAITAALGGFLFGYDTAVISGTIGFVKSKFALDALIEGWFVSSALVGCIAGVSFVGELSDRIGRKKALIASGLLFSVSAIGCVISASQTELIIYRIVGGVGGVDASTTVISPDIFNEFVAPYDAPLIEAADKAGQCISYHPCGGMMPILEDLAAMKPDAMETFTPIGMGADVDLAEAKRKIGDKVCMIGGFDQFHFLKDCTEEQTRAEVRRCFDAAGEGGGFILCPSDHFFEADLNLLHAFADEAKKCIY